jgi:hypothetical protein
LTKLTLPTSLAFALLLNVECAFGLQYAHRWDLSYTGQSKSLNQNGFSNFDNVAEHYLALGLEQSYYSKIWRIELRPELRVLSNPALSSANADLANSEISKKDRYFDFSKKLSLDRTSHVQMLSDLEKLFLRLTPGQFEITVGRLPFFPSIMRLSPVWNHLTPPTYLNAFSQLNFNSDLFAAQWSNDNITAKYTSVLHKESELGSQLVIVSKQFNDFEGQVLLGSLQSQTAAGFNLNLNLNDGLGKMEVLHLQNQTSNKDSLLKGALGFEQSWNESVFTNFELFINNRQNESTSTLEVQAFPRDKLYFLSQIDVTFKTYWLSSTTLVSNLNDSSHFLQTNLKRSLTDNLEISGFVKFPIGEDKTEFSKSSFYISENFFAGVSNVFGISTKYFF